MVRRALFGLALAALAWTGCSGPGSLGAFTPEGHGALFIIGGGDRPPALTARMAEVAGLRDGGYSVILPMASSQPDSAILWSGEALMDLGHKVVGFNIRPGVAPTAARLDSLRRARLIYISGGDQARFMASIAGTDVASALHDAFLNGSTIAGTSAGAAVMSEKMLTGEQRLHPEYSPTYAAIESDNIDLARGLGLLKGAIVDQHFLIRSRHNRLLTAILEDPSVIGIGIDESTALIVRDGYGEVTGASHVLVFQNTSGTAERRNGKLGARGVRLDLYLPGDRFRLR